MKNFYSNIYSFNLRILKKTVKYLSQGNLVAIPTETVYGLAGNAYSKKAVKRNKLRRILQEWLIKNIQKINNHKPYWLLVNLKFGDFCNDKSRLLEEFQKLMFKSRLIK